jgi:uncharacterized protein (DUF3084 family)
MEGGGGILVILAVIIMGGIIAPLGDRLGTRIGKKRLTLLGLRPRDTALWVTAFTGMAIAGLSLGLLLLVSDRVRIALFQINEVLGKLDAAQKQEQLVQAELKTAKGERTEAQAKLQETLRAAEASNRQRVEAQEKQQLAQKSLQQSQAKLKAADEQLQKSERSYEQVQKQLVALKTQERTLVGRLDSNQKQLAQLGTQRTKLQKDIKILGKGIIALQKQNRALAQDTINLYAALRRGSVIFQAGEIITTARIQGGLSPTRIKAALDVALSQAEMEVRRRAEIEGRQKGIQPLYPAQRAVLITANEAARLVTELQKPGEHAVQIFVTQNVLLEEAIRIPVVGKVFSNLHLFDKGTLMATRVVNPKEDKDKLIDQLQGLFDEAGSKARKAGILVLSNNQGTVGGIQLSSVQQMVGQIRQLEGTVVLQALTADDTYTSGPLQLMINVIQDGKVVGQVS